MRFFTYAQNDKYFDILEFVDEVQNAKRKAQNVETALRL